MGAHSNTQKYFNLAQKDHEVAEVLMGGSHLHVEVSAPGGVEVVVVGIKSPKWYESYKNSNHHTDICVPVRTDSPVKHSNSLEAKD